MRGEFFLLLIVEIFIARSKSGETFENFAATLVSSLSAAEIDTHKRQKIEFVEWGWGHIPTMRIYVNVCQLISERWEMLSHLKKLHNIIFGLFSSFLCFHCSSLLFSLTYLDFRSVCNSHWHSVVADFCFFCYFWRWAYDTDDDDCVIAEHAKKSSCCQAAAINSCAHLTNFTADQRASSNGIMRTREKKICDE